MSRLKGDTGMSPTGHNIAIGGRDDPSAGTRAGGRSANQEARVQEGP